MEQCHWIDLLWNSYRLPITISKDSEYLPTLREKFDNMFAGLRDSSAPEIILDTAKFYSSKILAAIDLYYCGDLINAQCIINNVFEDCCINNPYAISNINDSIAFPKVIEPSKSEVQFFRARLNENIVDFSSKDMSHIPFELRSIVKSERFSIPGLPCLYLGNTSYDCWIEMGRPADHMFNVSPVVLDNSQKIFNLAINPQIFYYVVDCCNDEKEKTFKLSYLMKLFMLNYATSFHVKEQNRSFKSEYIISQMLMLACKANNCDGITYYSKRVSDEAFAYRLCVNLALFATFENKEGLSSTINKHVRIGDSFNFAMFKHILSPSSDYSLRIDAANDFKNIGTFKKQTPYVETYFYDFDKYLFATWNPMERDFTYESDN